MSLIFNAPDYTIYLTGINNIYNREKIIKTILFRLSRIILNSLIVVECVFIEIHLSYAGTLENLIEPPQVAPVGVVTPYDLQTKLTKQQFFEMAAKSKNWWGNWQSLYVYSSAQRFYLDDHTIGLINKSSVIRYVLENGYGVIVPFDLTNTNILSGFINSSCCNFDTSIYSPGMAESIPGGTKMVSVAQWKNDACSARATVDLASGVAAMTQYVAPEMVPSDPNISRNQIIHPADYLRTQLRVMQLLCGEAHPGFMKAYQQFLDDYSDVIRVRYDDEMEDKRRIAEAVQIAAQQHDLEVKQKKEEEEKRKQTRDKIIAAQRKAEEKSETEAQVAKMAKDQLAYQRQQEKIAAYNADIKSGKRPVASIHDAIVYFNPKDGNRVMFQPEISPDNQTYKVTVIVDKPRSDGVIGRAGNLYCYLIFNDGNKIPNDLRINGWATAIGKYIGNSQYTTIGGEEKTMPVFDVLYIHGGN